MASAAKKAPAKKEEALTQAELKRLLDYDASTGEFRRLVSTSHKAKAGDIAGAVYKNGYCYISLHSKAYLAHRLAFLYMTGKWPEKDCDHINGDRTYNAWHNLRSVCRSENCKNVKAHRDNSSGVLGVSLSSSSKKWRARLYSGGKEVVLGYFDSKEEAAQAREAANKAYGFHENHGRTGRDNASPY